MTEKYLCFYDNGLTGDEEQDRTPVGYGSSREEAQAMGIRNALPNVAQTGVLSMSMGGFATVKQTTLTDAEYAHVCEIIDDFFSART